MSGWFNVGGPVSTVMDWLLGLRGVSWSDPRAVLSWRYPLAAWAWTVIILAALAVGFWSYHRLLAPRLGRLVLAPLRATVIIFLVALLTGPLLVVQQEKQETGWVVLLVDRSASMKIQDASGSDWMESDSKAPGFDSGIRPEIAPGLVPVSRDTALRHALARHAGVFASNKLGQGRQLLWLGFDVGVFSLESPASDAEALGEPDGNATAIRTAIEQALVRVSGQPVLGMVIFTDGRSPQGTGADLVRRLKQRGINVFPVPLGGDFVPQDLTISQVDAPDKAFIKDQVPVTVWLERSASDSPVDPKPVLVRLIDPEQPDRPLDEQVLADGDLSQPIHLRARWPIVGSVTWRVQVQYDTAGPQVPKALTDNNIYPVHIEFVDRPVRVLYVEGLPRWEYRYLKNLLVREKSIRSSIFLISADSAFAQEGDEPIKRLPRDREEFKPYDVMIIGDVPADYFSTQQLGLIRDQVSVGGAGLMWIGGQLHTPRAYEGTQLADLLPMLHPAAVQRLTGGVALRVRPAPLARALSVLRLQGPDNAEPTTAGWPVSLASLHWVQQLGPLKPAAEVLATVHNGMQEPAALIAMLRYGAGQVLYLGTDETWRWRYGRGELYFEQFWTQLIQFMGRGRVEQDWRRLRLRVSHRRPAINAAVSVFATIEDSRLMKQNLAKIDVSVRRGTGPDAIEVDRVELVRSTNDPTESGHFGNGVRYEAIWRPRMVGQFTLHLVDPHLEDLNVTWGPMQVTHDDSERRQRRVDHGRLKKLAEGTGGQVIQLADLDVLLEVIRKPGLIPDDISESLWNSPLSLLVVLLLLSIEWVCRKWIYLA